MPPDFETIIYAFSHLPEDDVLLESFVDEHCAYYCADFDLEHDREGCKSLPQEFLVRFMLRYSKSLQKPLTDATKYLGEVYEEEEEEEDSSDEPVLNLGIQ